MTNSLELLRLADSLDRQGFYKLAQEAEEAAQQQENQENSSDVYGTAGNTAELYSAYNFMRQLVGLGLNSQYFQQLITTYKLTSVDQMINVFARLGNTKASELFKAISNNKFLAARQKNLFTYLQSFEPGALFTAEEMKILQNATKYTAPAIGSGLNTIEKFKNLTGISEEVINANPTKFRDVLRFLGNGQTQEAANILKGIEGLEATQIEAIMFNSKAIQSEIQTAENVLKFDQVALQKGNSVFTALRAMAAEIPVLGKVLQILEVGISKGLPILGILAGAVEVIAYSNQLKSAPEEEKADIRMDIAQGVINIIGNACMLFPVTAPIGGIILGLNFAADVVQGQSKNWMAQAEGFENAEQMKQTKQIAEQDLSVVSTNPEVTKIMDYIIKKKWAYLSDPIGYKTEVSQLLTPNGVLMEAGSLYGSDANANFWKWSKNTNSPEYLELIQSITQLKQKLYRDARSDPYNFIRSKNPGFTPPRAAKVKVKLKYA
jgi:hypothetical protein